MVPESTSSTTDSNRSPVMNAIIGGIAGVLLSFVPLSPLLGGGIAGYLQHGTRKNGLKVGAWAGLVMLVPFIFIGFLLMMLLGLGGISATYGVHMGVTPVVVAFFGLVLIGLSAIYTVGLSALGGYLGVYVWEEVNSDGRG